MTTPSMLHRQPRSTAQVDLKAWAQIGLVAAAVSIVAVLIVQVLAITLWPDIALFKPLDNYARSAIFVLIPVIAATGLFAWLAGRREQPVRDFVILGAVVLLASFIPDYALPDPNKTLLASTVAAFLHVVAGIVTTLMLVNGYQRLARQK